MASLVLAMPGLCEEVDPRARPIYGADDRIEVGKAAQELASAARSVAAIVRSDNIEVGQGGAMALRGDGILDDPPWCPRERFVAQPRAAYCTGFLVSQNLIATAAHCVRADEDTGARGLACSELSVVFDYRMSADGEGTEALERDAIYRCDAVEDGLYYPGGGPDWRIFRLDRAVLSAERPALPISTATDLSPGTAVASIGHPAGLPMKVMGNAAVLRARPLGGYITDLDTFTGSSGSPVLADLGCGSVVVGLLSNGHADFIASETRPQAGQRCLSSTRCREGACLGEQVTSSSHLASYADRPFVSCPTPAVGVEGR